MKNSNKKTQEKKSSTMKAETRNESALLRGRAHRLLAQLGEDPSVPVSPFAEVLQAGRAPRFYVGMDLSDKKSRLCFLDCAGVIVAEAEVATTRAEMKEYFCVIPYSRIALEVGTHSPWLSGLLKEIGHEVFVANPRKMESIHKNRRKNDRVDARTLARLARADVALLHPIQHRGAEVRQDLVLLRARDGRVSVRTKLSNSVRGLVKSVGGRLPSCSAEAFPKRVADSIPEGVRDALMPMVGEIESLTEKIHGYDKRVSEMARKKYPETALLNQPEGVGDLTALAFLLTLESPECCRKSRDVGAYLGLVPRQYDSGNSSPQLRITKTGDVMLRRLLVGSAHYILGPFGKDSDLRRHGMKIASRGGKNAKKRAVVAVARKLGVLMHRLWRNAEAYAPLHNARLAEESVEAVVNA
jgi:transposase